ncbi:carbohydrate sulfotransferase 9-like [Haliotis rubra]|uniref:carbohydrate sulfotransferase 9-like n=1 Tax=Haliotis rubra TaxID=36100 RepID=UPI001EE5E50D|nr:carbohydrate sulfotransferase 9-like [Haliotis rubra]
MEGIQTSDESTLLKRYHDSLMNALGNRTEETKLPNPNRYAERRNYLRRACVSIPGRQKTLRSLHTLWYMDSQKMLYCSVAKSGSSFWRRTWKALSAYEGKETSPYKFAHSEFKSEYYRLDIINATKSAEAGFSLSRLLETSFKYIFTRDPYARIFSAYVDKFVAPNKYLWKQIGKKIARSRDFASDKSLRCGHDVTFREFVKYIIRTPRRRLDDHFIPVASVCDVCNLQYDVVAKMETFKEDVSYILRHLNVDNRIKFKDFGVEHTVDSVVDYVTRAFSQRERISSCVSFHTALRRLWRQMQILGIISKQEDFPLTPEQSETYKQTEVINLALAAHWRSGDISTSNKREAFIQAYQQIPLADMEALSQKYQKDFLLFDYDDRPQMLFQKSEQLYMTFDYFDVLKE